MPLLYLRKLPRLSPVGQVLSQPIPQADEEPFPPIYQPGKLVDLDAVAQVPVPHLLDVYPPTSPRF